MITLPNVVIKDFNGEKGLDIISRLLQERKIMIFDQFDDNLAASVIAQIIYLSELDKEKDIEILINSPGGVVTSGLGIYDTMQLVPNNIVTKCFGQACSMGAFILSCGEKGKRYATKNSRIMIHQPSGGARGQETDIQIQAKEIQRLKEMLTQTIADNCGISYEKALASMERDNFMSAQEALEYGLIDEIL